MVTNVYVDGFNLYYGCLKGSPYKWLDVKALRQVLLPRDTIGTIRYFTARIDARPQDPDGRCAKTPTCGRPRCPRSGSTWACSSRGPLGCTSPNPSPAVPRSR